MLRVILVLCLTAGTFSQFNYTRLLELTNKYRSNIGSLSGVVWPYINTYNATSKVSNLGTAYPNLTGSGYTAAIAWNEGMTAFLNLTTYIVQETPNNAARVNLTLNSKMAASSLAHSTDIGSKGLTGHIGSDGSNFTTRMLRQGTTITYLASENICYRCLTPEMAAFVWMLDDGVPSRGHRLNLMNTQIRAIGFGCAPHTVWNNSCTANAAVNLV